jgi:hypothetical protein
VRKHVLGILRQVGREVTRARVQRLGAVRDRGQARARGDEQAIARAEHKVVAAGDDGDATRERGRGRGDAQDREDDALRDGLLRRAREPERGGGEAGREEEAELERLRRGGDEGPGGQIPKRRGRTACAGEKPVVARYAGKCVAFAEKPVSTTWSTGGGVCAVSALIWIEPYECPTATIVLKDVFPIAPVRSIFAIWVAIATSVAACTTLGSSLSASAATSRRRGAHL